MSNSSFVHFLGKHTPVSPLSRYDGYLSFIPAASETNEEVLPAHRYLYNKDFFWLEMKDTVQDTLFKLEIDTAQDCLWIYIDMLGHATLLLSDPQHLSTRDILCYVPHLNPYPILLSNGKNWFFLIGISPQHFESLAEEYPLLQKLAVTEKCPGNSLILGQTHIHAKLYSTLESLRRIEFRPFSSYYLLSAWDLRIFQIIFNEAKEVKTTEEDYGLTLYYKSLAYIRDHFWKEGFSVQQVAEAMHVSVRKLTRSFENRSYNVSSYILEMKLDKAKEMLLKSDSSIAAICFDLYFANAKHFSRVFKKRYGLSPQAFRNKMQTKSLFN